MINSQKCDYWLIWSNINNGASLGQKFDRFIGQIYLRKKIVAYVKDERSNFTCNDYCIKNCCNYESFGLEERF